MKLPPELEAKLGKLNEVTIDADLADLKQQAEGWARAEGVVEGVVEGDDEIKVEDLVPVDIPHGLYETGGGYNWKKIPDVKFEANDIIIDGIAQVEDWKDYDDDDS